MPLHRVGEWGSVSSLAPHRKEFVPFGEGFLDGGDRISAGRVVALDNRHVDAVDGSVREEPSHAVTVSDFDS